jgi:predicted nucleic acid-binding protein
MNSLAFFDTNILVYADDTSAPEKQARAFQLFADHRRQNTAVVSLQVMQEYFTIATRKLRIDAQVAQRKVELLSRVIVVRFVEADILSAIEFHRLTQISFWDALIVQAARLARARVLYSEDFQHGATLGGVRVVNPFLEGA